MKTVDRVRSEFYRWIQKDVNRELDSDLHLLRQVKGTTGILACQYFDSLSNHERTNSLISLSKKILISNGNSVGQELNEKDKQRWQQFEEAIFVNPINPEYLDRFFTEESIQERKNFNVRLLRSEMRKACEPYLGRPERSGGKVLSYKTNIGRFTIITEIDLGGWSQLRYLHWVQYDDGTSMNRPPIIMADFLRWLGLGEASWEFITDEDIPDVSAVVSYLCHHFIEGVRPILQSL